MKQPIQSLRPPKPGQKGTHGLFAGIGILFVAPILKLPCCGEALNAEIQNVHKYLLSNVSKSSPHFFSAGLRGSLVYRGSLLQNRFLEFTKSNEYLGIDHSVVVNHNTL